jgi:hypothetical protein
VFKELRDDLGVPMPAGGDLTAWARRGVLLLNAVLTVRAGKAGSHAGKGWEEFTDAVIRVLDASEERVVFVLWGAYARKKRDLVTNPRHVVLEAGHPSPMNPRGFLGTRPFGKVNKALADAGRPEIDWRRTIATGSPISPLLWAPSGAHPAETRKVRSTSAAANTHVTAVVQPSSRIWSTVAASRRLPWPARCRAGSTSSVRSSPVVAASWSGSPAGAWAAKPVMTPSSTATSSRWRGLGGADTASAHRSRHSVVASGLVSSSRAGAGRTSA